MPNFKKFNRGHPFKRRFPNRHNSPKRFHNDNSKPKFNNSPAACLNENDVGITEYVTETEGFQAVIKARFSDFQVNEIDLDNKIVKLTNMEIPECFCENQTSTAPDLNSKPLDLIPDDIWQSVKQMMSSDEEEIKEVTFDVTDITKEDRTNTHRTIKALFGSSIVSTTTTRDEKKYIIFKKYEKGDKIDRRTKWPSDKEYLHFVAYKESLDTMQACMIISNYLKMPTSAFTYAGVKDRRSKSSQWFSVRKVNPAKLLAKIERSHKLKVGNFTLKDKPLRLGDLKGNRFRVALRNVQGTDEVINRSLKTLKNTGFINYYGMQRFGSDKDVPTYLIGIELLRGNWEKACDLILKPKQGDDPKLDVSRAKRVYSDTKNADAALNELKYNNSKHKSIEGKLLAGLAKGHANDRVNALENIPRNMRLLYLHAFQSLIWNHIASRRIQNYGRKVVAGDMVVLSDQDATQEVDEYFAGDDIAKENDEDFEENVDHFKEGTSKSTENENNMEHSESSKQKFEELRKKFKILKESDVPNYSIYDVVLPLPGYDMIYPENMKDDYKELLETYGLSLEMTKQKVRTYTLSGAYRKLLAKPQDLSWKIMYYSDPNYNLIRSDLEEMNGENEPESVEGGEYKALILEFSLKPSNYATMLLRELIKMDTSRSAQAKLNDYHQPVKDDTPKQIEIKNANKELEKAQENRMLSIKRLLENCDEERDISSKKAKISDSPEKI